jgi:hypothetical protein
MGSCRRLPLLLAVPILVGAGCVVPMGPKWSDPESNSPPVIASAVPAIGSVLDMAADGGVPLGVRVVISDANTSDRIYARWIIDYPPYQESQTRVALRAVLPPANEAQRSPIEFSPNCSDDQIARGFVAHRLLLAVSDRPFSDEDASKPDAVPAGNFLVEGSWAFNQDCP